MRRVALLAVSLLACTPGRERGAPPVSADSLYAAGNFAGARVAYRTQLRGTIPSSVVRAHLLTSVALSAYHLGDYDEAQRVADSALALMGPSASIAEAFRVHNALGLIAWHQGRLAAADTFWHNALRLATAAHDTSAIAKASSNLALVLTDYGEFSAARTALVTARDAAHAIGDSKVEGNAYTNLAMLSLRTGDVVAAEEEARRALPIYRLAHYATGEQNALGQLATIYASKGDPQAAFAALDSALTIVRREQLQQEEASDLQILGDLYADAGDLRSAASYYQRAERQFTALGVDLEAANLMRARASLDAALGDTVSARARAAAALESHRKLGARAEELKDRLTLLDLAIPSDGAARQALNDAFTLAVSLGSDAARVQTVLARARYEERRGHPREVLTTLSHDLRHPGELDHESLWQAAALRLRAWSRLGKLDSAEAWGRQAVRLIERARGSYASPQLRTAYIGRMAQVYTDLVLVLLRKGDVTAAFAIADAARGRALVEHLAAARAELGTNSAPALFLDAELLANRIDSLVSRLDAASGGRSNQRGVGATDAYRELAAQLVQARAEYEAITERAESDDNAQLLGLTTADARRVQGSLAPDEALLDYLVTRDTLLTFVVTSKAIGVARTAVPERDLSAHARVLRELLGSRTAPASSAPAAQALYALLIAPALESGVLRDVSRLVIVPHQSLTHVPFAALEDQRTGRRLVEQYVLSYLPSAAALPVIRERDNLRQQGSASGPGEAFALAPFTRDLPATGAEARRFAARVPNATTRVGADATERALRVALTSGDIVHVATHAELNQRNPMFSEIRLARGSGPPEDDGRLEVHEIFGLHVQSRLVFLSGCETAAGSAWATDFQRGEDYATLSRALLYAGARNVIATLWPIDDEGAAQLADSFYANRRQADDADALARAQRTMMRDSRFRSPYYWASYQLSGAGR